MLLCYPIDVRKEFTKKTGLFFTASMMTALVPGVQCFARAIEFESHALAGGAQVLSSDFNDIECALTWSKAVL